MCIRDRVSSRYNPVGSYVKYFALQENLEGKRKFLSFQGVETAFYVWLNGRFVGYSEDSFTPAEFEVTDYLEELSLIHIWRKQFYGTLSCNRGVTCKGEDN